MWDKHTIPASLLAHAVDPNRLGFKDTSEVEPLDDMISETTRME